jgi:uncharacterized membrane protein
VGIGSTAYKVVFMLHILAVVVGFGGVMLNGLYGAQAKKRPGAGGLAIGEANLFVSDVAEKVIYTVPLWGILLVFMSDKVWNFGQGWVIGALVLYIAALSFVILVQVPNSKRMVALAGELVAAGPPPAGQSGPPPQVAQMEGLEKKLGMGGMFLSLAIVAVLFLMVFKPGL